MFQRLHRWRLVQLIEIPHEHSQSELWCDFRIPGHELIAVVIKIEIEWVLGVHIDPGSLVTYLEP